MSKDKEVSTPLAGHFKLNIKQYPTSEKDKEDLKKFPYVSAVGSLMYAMVCTRPDITHAVGVVNRYLSNPGKEHWNAVKWILRYLKGTSRLCLCFGNGKTMLDGYTNADMAGDLDNRKSTSGYLMIFAGGAVSWQSKLQKCIALSSMEAEYIATTEACKETLWLQKFVQELVLDSKLLILENVHTNDNGADMFTKALPKKKLLFCRQEADLVEPPNELEGEIVGCGPAHFWGQPTYANA
ncbi:secreted RxLR effector protein 161-like [Coffea arabica]|uniref:Secreted RxLR effector protein 161-like n=1 Tax=Coffea arabica TaxID=13443 RepID=A0ABM4URA2_COFAR